MFSRDKTLLQQPLLLHIRTITFPLAFENVLKNLHAASVTRFHAHVTFAVLEEEGEASIFHLNSSLDAQYHYHNVGTGTKWHVHIFNNPAIRYIIPHRLSQPLTQWNKWAASDSPNVLFSLPKCRKFHFMVLVYKKKAFRGFRESVVTQQLFQSLWG